MNRNCYGCSIMTVQLTELPLQLDLKEQTVLEIMVSFYNLISKVGDLRQGVTQKFPFQSYYTKV